MERGPRLHVFLGGYEYVGQANDLFARCQLKYQVEDVLQISHFRVRGA